MSALPTTPVAPVVLPGGAKKTLLLDVERGFGSVADLMKLGTVQRVPIDSFQEFAAVVEQIRTGKLTPDVVVLDSLGMLASKIRWAISSGDSGALALESLWPNRRRLKSSISDWGEMSDLIVVALNVLRGCRPMLVIICHETNESAHGEKLEVRAPDLSAALFRDVDRNSDAIIRMGITSSESDDATTGVRYPKGTRFLNLVPDADFVAGVRVTLDVVPPPVLYNPTLQRLRNAFGGVLPHTVTLYGRSKLGKTTLACSLSRPLKRPPQDPATQSQPEAGAAAPVVSTIASPEAAVSVVSESAASLDATPLALAGKENS